MKRVFKIIIAVVAIVAIGTAIYLLDNYEPDDSAMGIIDSSDSGYVVNMNDSYISFEPEDPVGGLIFYPGGKVQYESYAPLMGTFAEAGITCVLMKMPASLAVFDKNAADGVKAHFSNVYEWCIGGHSLGGVMASSYLADHMDEYMGLVLLASYTTTDLSDSDIMTLSIYGSRDGVLNMDSYEENRCNLPKGYREVVLRGGCHAYFGSYGFQDKDGNPTITREDQIAQTAIEVAGLYIKDQKELDDIWERIKPRYDHGR